MTSFPPEPLTVIEMVFGLIFLPAYLILSFIGVGIFFILKRISNWKKWNFKKLRWLSVTPLAIFIIIVVSIMLSEGYKVGIGSF